AAGQALPRRHVGKQPRQRRGSRLGFRDRLGEHGCGGTGPGVDHLHKRRRGLSTGPPLVLCPHCAMTVPEGDFCGHCGAHLTTASATRRHAFAAVPSESVAHLSVVSTLFPHLTHRRGGAFRWTLVGGSVVVVLL